jgi:hypothetical protein
MATYDPKFAKFVPDIIIHHSPCPDGDAAAWLWCKNLKSVHWRGQLVRCDNKDKIDLDALLERFYFSTYVIHAT